MIHENCPVSWLQAAAAILEQGLPLVASRGTAGAWEKEVLEVIS